MSHLLLNHSVSCSYTQRHLFQLILKSYYFSKEINREHEHISHSTKSSHQSTWKDDTFSVVSNLLTDAMPIRQNVCKLIIVCDYNTGDSLLLKNIKRKQQVCCSRCSAHPAVQHVLDLYFNVIITKIYLPISAMVLSYRYLSMTTTEYR